jgi:NADPH-dependent curcumin reductase CurA
MAVVKSRATWHDIAIECQEDEMPELTSREIHLVNRPTGAPTPDDFELVTTTVPEPGEGEVRVRNIWMSVDPYMRGRMYDRPSYVPPFELGAAMGGGAVGVVESSRDQRFSEGDHVMSMYGWREVFAAPGSELLEIDPSIAPPQAFLGALGMPGLTAWVGLLEIGALKEGDHVFISGAAGAVGMVACQIAKIHGCTVVGSAGSDEKAAWLTDELGVDTAFNYKSVGNLQAHLPTVAGDGFDLYFDNVGGDHLETALLCMKDFGRVVLCGMIDQYNALIPRGPRSLIVAIGKRLTLRGFIVSDHLDLQPRFLEDMAKWTAEGRMKRHETVVEGIENAADAFMGLFSGANIGKMLVKL